MRTYIRSLRALFLSVVFSAALFSSSFALSGRVAGENNSPGKGYAEDLGAAPEIVLQDLNRDTVTLSKYRGNKTVIIFFWTTWCMNCRAGIRTLNEMYPEIIKDNFEVLAINVGEPENRVSNFVKANKLRFKVILDTGGSAAASYKLIGVPTYVIVDKNGKMRFYNHYFPKNDFKKIGSTQQLLEE